MTVRRGTSGVNNALAAIDDLYIRRGPPGQGPCFELPLRAPGMQDWAVLGWQTRDAGATHASWSRPG